MPNQAHVVPIGCIGNSAGVPQSRLARWVRAGAGYNVVSRALVAQWIEHQLAELGVGGSSPLERANLSLFIRSPFRAHGWHFVQRLVVVPVRGVFGTRRIPYSTLNRLKR